MERRAGIVQRAKEAIKKFRQPVERRLTHENSDILVAVDYALDHLFGRNTDDYVSKFAGKLFTNPYFTQNEINANSLGYQCTQFSLELGRNLASLGLEVEIHGSNHRNTAPHAYLAVNGILVDPTMGQFVDGHNHVFVGTRQQLERLVVEQAGEGKQYKLRYVRLDETNGQFFERIWGSTSRMVLQLEQGKPT